MHDRLHWSRVARTLHSAFSLSHPNSFSVGSLSHEAVHTCCMAQAIKIISAVVAWKSECRSHCLDTEIRTLRNRTKHLGEYCWKRYLLSVGVLPAAIALPSTSAPSFDRSSAFLFLSITNVASAVMFFFFFRSMRLDINNVLIPILFRALHQEFPKIFKPGEETSKYCWTKFRSVDRSNGGRQWQSQLGGLQRRSESYNFQCGRTGRFEFQFSFGRHCPSRFVSDGCNCF